MTFSLDYSVVFSVFMAALLWLYLKRILEPKYVKKLVQNQIGDLPRGSAKLVLISTLRHIAGCAALAGIIVFSALLILPRYLERLAENDQGLGSLVQIRSWVESTLSNSFFSSLSSWIVALVLLSVLYVFISYTRSKQRWADAMQRLRNDVAKTVDNLTPDQLREVAQERTPDALASLEKSIEEKAKENANRIEGALKSPLLQVGDGAEVSLQDLERHIAALRLPVTAQEAEEEGETVEVLNDLRNASADTLAKRLSELKLDLKLELETATGSLPVTLAEAEANYSAYAERLPDQGRALKALVVETRMRLSETLAQSAARSEPELFREWVAAFLSGTSAVKFAGRLGAVARTGVLVTLLLGLVGIGAQVNGNVLRDTVSNMELSLGKTLADQELAAAIASRPEDENASADIELASDEETIAQLTVAMRASVVRALQAGNLGQTARTVSRRQTFDLSRTNARQRILQASTRTAPTRVVGAGTAVQFQARAPAVSGAVQQFDDILDDSIDRRIKRMRSNEAVWRKMRASAVRPASRDLVSREFLRAAFPGNRVPAPMAMRLWTERATMDVARNAVRTGVIPDSYTPRTRIDSMPDLISTRDRRVIKDFDSRTPRQVTSHLNMVDTGRVDPGSLHRASASRTPRPSGGTSAYSRVFPTSPSSVGSRVASARSYKSIRFNRRVGGVVIGRGPETTDVEFEINTFEWKLIGDDLIEITVESDASGRVELGRFHPAIAHHALAYAADGRVVTATLPQVQQQSAPGAHEIDVPTRQVVVHPAFEDTAFACAAIEIDRFVDRSIYSDRPDRQSLQVDRRAVTLFGRVLESARYRGADMDALLGALEEIKPYAASCGTGKDCFPIETYSRSGLSFEGVNGVLSCLSSNETCAPALNDLNNFASYSVDSGVREQPYSFDKKLEFLRMDAHRADFLWPLDFVVQAVPISLTNQDLDIPDQLEPWTFPNFSDDLRSLVSLDVKANSELGQVLDHMRQFTVLQRLFRLALDGQLGLEFPLDALIDMQLATRNFVKNERHEHWNLSHSNPNADFVRMIQQEERGLVSAMRTLRNSSTPANCDKIIDQQLSIAKNQQWPMEESIWPALGNIADTCSAASDSSDFLNRFDALQELDLIEEAIAIHIGVTGPESLGICPPL